MENIKSNAREVIYLITELNQIVRELMESIRELDISIDNKIEQIKEQTK